MTDPTEYPCARGCTHDPIGDEPPKPKAARHGQLCDSCFYRVKAALNLVPDLMANMRAQIVSFGAQPITQRITGGGFVSPAPLNIGPLDAGDSLYARLAEWIESFANEFHVAAPYMRRWSVNGEAQGSDRVSVEVAHIRAAQMANWFLDRLEQVCESQAAVAFHDDLCWGNEDARGVFPLSAAYGVKARPVRDAAKRECEVCGEHEVFAAMLFGATKEAEVTVMCGFCAHVVEPNAKAYGEYLSAKKENEEEMA